MGENVGIMRFASGGYGPLWPTYGKVAWFDYESMTWVEVDEPRAGDDRRNDD